MPDGGVQEIQQVPVHNGVGLGRDVDHQGSRGRPRRLDEGQGRAGFGEMGVCVGRGTDTSSTDGRCLAPRRPNRLHALTPTRALCYTVSPMTVITLDARDSTQALA